MLPHIQGKQIGREVIQIGVQENIIFIMVIQLTITMIWMGMAN